MLPLSLQEQTKDITIIAGATVRPAPLPYLTRAGYPHMALPVQLKTESIFEPIGLPTQALLADSSVESRSNRCYRCIDKLDRLCDTCKISGRTGTSSCDFYTGQCTSACACLSLDSCDFDCNDCPDKLCESLGAVCVGICESFCK